MDSGDAPDQSIVAAVLAGERDRYAVLVQRHGARLYHALWRLCGSADAAEELSQATLVRAYFALGTFKPEYRFSTWLFQIGYHLFLNERRDHRREVALDDIVDPEVETPRYLEDPGAPPAALVEGRETRHAISAAMGALPEEFRSIIVMRHVEELSYTEICAVTGLPMGTVKSRIARARQQLAQLLAGER